MRRLRHCWILFSWTATCCLASSEDPSVPYALDKSSLWSKVENWAGNALSLWGYVESLAEEECPELFACPNGLSPQTNHIHKPVANGCGSFGYNVDKYVAGGMTKCCDTHDVCFSTCGSKKSDCDNVFKKCLYDVCRTDAGSVKNTKVCQISAKVLYGATTLAGCSSFQQAQSAACLCQADSHDHFRKKHRQEF